MTFLDRISAHWQAIVKPRPGATRQDVRGSLSTYQPFLSRKDLKDWRDAQQAARAQFLPSRLLLYNLYDELVLDAHLTSVMQTRRLQVMGTPFRLISKDKQTDAEATDLLHKPWFRDFCTYALDSIYYGHSLVELGPLNEEGQVSSVDLVPRRNVRPETGELLLSVFAGQAGTNVIGYRDQPEFWLVEAGNPRDLGLLEKAAPHVLWKKSVSQAWSEFCDKFGMPMRLGKTMATDLEELNKFDTMLRNMGSAFWARLNTNNGEDISLVESKSTDAYQVYDARIERSNSEISKLIFGQTMTADNGSSRSQSEVHERVGESYTDDDRTMLADIINARLLPLLRRIGYPLADGLRFEYALDKDLPKSEQWKIVDGLMQRGYKVDNQYLTDTFGVPLEEKAPEAGQVYGYHIETGAVSTDDVRVRLGFEAINATESEAQRALLAKLRLAEAAKSAGLGLAESLQLAGLPAPPAATEPDGDEGTPPDGDGGTPPPPVPTVPGKPKGSTPANVGPTAAAAGVGQLEAKATTKALRDGLAEATDLLVQLLAGGTTPQAFDRGVFGWYRDGFTDALTAGWADAAPALRESVAEFAGFKAAALQRDLLAALTGPDPDAVAAVVDRFNGEWLETEAQHIVAAGQMAEKWAGFNDDAMLRYDSVGDGLVRPDHVLLDGTTLPKSAAFWNTYYPPCGYNCRCTVVELEADAEPKDAPAELPDVPPGMVNAGATGKVFGDDHPYISGLNAKQRKAIKDAASAAAA